MTTLLDKVFGTYLGMEFKEDSIVVTFLRNNFSGLTILSSSTFPLRYDDMVSDEIREYISKHSADVSKVFASIPDQWAITKFIDVPSMKGKGKSALANLMRFEIERHIPFPIEDVAYDFLVMDEKDMKYSTVFIAVQTEKIEQIKEFLDKLSLQPHAITLSSFAVLNAIELSGVPAGGWQEVIGIVRKSDSLGKKGETNISLYMDKTNASMAILRNGLCSHLRSFRLNRSHPVEFISEEVAGYLAEVQSMLVVERFNKLMITSDKSSPSGLADEFKDKIKVDGDTIEQVLHFSGDLKGMEMNGLSASIGACFAGLGIGTYKLNLLPHRIDYEIKRIAPFTTKIFLILILILVVGIFATEAVKQKSLLGKMEEALKTNAPEVKGIEKLLSDITSLKQQSDLLHEIRENEIALEILAELTNILPKDAWVSNLNYKSSDFKDRKKTAGELVVNGYAAASSTLIPLLEDSPLFEKVEFVGPIKKTRDMEQFKLSAKIALPSEQEDMRNDENR